jgi:hypothetical protein
LEADQEEEYEPMHSDPGYGDQRRKAEPALREDAEEEDQERDFREDFGEDVEQLSGIEELLGPRVSWCGVLVD